MNRRRLLAAGASALAATLAGCTGDDGGGGGGATATTAEAEGGGPYGGGGDDTTGTTAATTENEETTAATTTSGGGGGGDATVVAVGPGGETRFDPETVTVAAGDTVRWEWDSGGHNVRPDSQPADADWSGTPGGDGDTYGDGYTYEFTFEVAGQYEYYCAPHQSLGMVGTVVVES